MDLLNTVVPRSMQSAAFMRNTFGRRAEIIDALERRAVTLCQQLMARDTEVTTRLKR